MKNIRIMVKTIKNSNLQKLNVVKSKKILASYINLQKNIIEINIKSHLKFFQVMRYGNSFLQNSF